MPETKGVLPLNEVEDRAAAVLTLMAARCLVRGESPEGLWRQLVQMLEEDDNLP
jgi:hypothetical protein